MRSPEVAAPERLLIWQAAARLNRSPQTVRAWVRSGELPAEKLPGRTGAFLIDPADVARYAADLAVSR